MWNPGGSSVMSKDDVQAVEMLSDDEIVGRFQRTGDAASFAELFGRHRKHVYFACRRFFADGSAAEDATQDTFLRAYQNMHRFGGGDVRAWLTRIARNVCIDGWRKGAMERGAAQVESVEPQAPGTLDEAVYLRLAVATLREELAALPSEQRQCLELKIEGFSYEETASRLGLSIAAVKSHLQNGRRMLWVRMKGVLPEWQ